MTAFLHWAQSIVVGTLNGIVRFVLGTVLLAVLLLVVLFAVGSGLGDGLPGKMVLKLDLRQPIKDSANPGVLAFERTPTIMDIVLALDRAGRDGRVKGMLVRLGSAELSVPQAEEIDAAVDRFRRTGKYVTAYSQGFLSQGMGDYLAAASANEIWMQPKSPFSPAGTAAGAIFLRGFFDKIQAVPQIVKRSDYKSAADTFMEKDYTPADREQTNALLQSWYNSAVGSIATNRRLEASAIVADLQLSPQFAEDARRDRLIDRIGYDDEAESAARGRTGNARVVSIMDYERATEGASRFGDGPHLALIEGNGEIVEGTIQRGSLFEQPTVIAGDDFAEAIRKATRDSSIRAIVLRIDSPGGSVTASDQILDALKKAQLAGKPVVVSMGAVAASGGYYVSCAANRIVAEPGTITGSIGVLTGKVSFRNTLGLVGITEDELGVGKNALYDSSMTPFTPDQLANLNEQADAIYGDFLKKVSLGRKIPLESVRTIAKGRVWSGADARSKGLVDDLGGFWTAVADAKAAAGIEAGQRVEFKRYPESEGFFQAVKDALSGTEAGVRVMEGLTRLADSPVIRTALGALAEAPRSGIELRAPNLPIR